MESERPPSRWRPAAREMRFAVYLLIVLGIAAWRFLPRPWTPALTIETEHYVIASTAFVSADLLARMAGRDYKIMTILFVQESADAGLILRKSRNNLRAAVFRTGTGRLGGGQTSKSQENT